MRAMSPPCDHAGNPLNPGETYSLCISKVRNRELKARLQAATPLVEQAAADYDAQASGAMLYRLSTHNGIGALTTLEMVNVYTNGMVPVKIPGRSVYDRIINAAPLGICPLCDLGSVTTLDHHLPKSDYPGLAVTPNNLIPSCMRCQGAKHRSVPRTAEEQTLHPYFDNFESRPWLIAEIQRTAPASFTFRVDSLAQWDAITIERLRHHLTVFKIPALYASNAAQELNNIRKRLTDLFSVGGRDEVQSHLMEEAASRRAARLNSWQAAMYSAASRDGWFCQDGFAR